MKKVMKNIKEKLKKGSKAVKGFTLVEMLAAIGVAGILGGIVTPAAINSLAKSRQAKCAENLRQFGSALVQYVNDTGAYPASATNVTGTGGEVRQRWFNTLSPYMGADERARTNAQGATSVSNSQGDLDQSVFTRAFICPEIEGEWKIGRNNSYGYNHQYLGNARSASANAGRKKNALVNFPVTRTDLKDPTRTIAIADTDGTGHLDPYKPPTEMLADTWGSGALTFIGGETSAQTASQIIGQRLTTLGNEGYQIDPTFLPVRNLTGTSTTVDICGAAGGSNSYSQAARGVVSNRHDGGANVCFADGHVEFLMREAVYAHPSTGMPSNRLWNGFGRDNDENGDGIVKLNDPIFDSNEWICDVNGNGIAGAGEANTKIGADIDAVAAAGYMAEANFGFLLGSNKLDSDTETVNARGGKTEKALLEDTNGPTIPKRIPFPLIRTVMHQSSM